MRQSCFNLWMNGVVVCYAIVQFLAWSKLRLQGSTSWGASRAWRKMWARCEWWSLLLRASLILLKQRSLMFWCSSAFQDCWWLNGIAQPLDGPPRLLTSFVWWVWLKEIKQGFLLFAQSIRTLKAMGCLASMQAGWIDLPVGVGGKCHHQFPWFGGWHCADASPNHLSVYFDFTGATAAPQAAGWDRNVCVASCF